MADVKNSQNKENKKEPSLYELLQEYNKTVYKKAEKPAVSKQEDKRKEQELLIQRNRERVKIFKDIVRKVEYSNKSYFSGLGLNVSNLNFINTFTADGNLKNQNVVVFKYNGKDASGKNRNKTIALNMDMDKLLQLPAHEVYAILTREVIDSVMSEERYMFANGYTAGNESQLGKDQKYMTEQHREKNSQYNLYKLAAYIESYLKEHGYINDINGAEKFNSLSIAVQIKDSLSNDELEKFMAGKLGYAEIDKIITENKGIIENSNEKLVELNNSDAESTYHEGEKKGVFGKINMYKYSEMQQVDLNNREKQTEFAVKTGKKLKGELDALKNDMSDQAKVRSFCEKLIAEITANYGMDKIDVQFTNDPKSRCYGEYHDKGAAGHYISINLANIDNVVELASTITHELTHAADSELNKKSGNVTSRGRGLLNNISENISGSGYDRNSEQYKLLQEVNTACYYLNPNERHARIAEYTSLEMMVEMVGDDPKLKAQLATSMSDYVNYLKTTIDKGINLESKISEYKAKLASMPRTPAAGYEMLKSRIDYLENIAIQGKSFEAEDAKINYITKMKDNLLNSEHTFANEDNQFMTGVDQTKDNEEYAIKLIQEEGLDANQILKRINNGLSKERVEQLIAENKVNYIGE